MTDCETLSKTFFTSEGVASEPLEKPPEIFGSAWVAVIFCDDELLFLMR